MTSTLKPQEDPLRGKLQEYAKRYRKQTLYWILSYRFLLVASAFLSASAAVVVNLDFLPEQGEKQVSRNDIAAILAASSAVVTTLVGSLSFENNWRTNRQARDRVDQLILELQREKPNREQIIDQLQNIIESRITDLPSREQVTRSGETND
ncbi:SLATT domain-containing protein [Leptothoe sp. PORK10 BA2]|uniref:SLATT domain-containing protein n=1 Tax=Leptothoe sp. PORK10 BA2 TaxID=3110254 RepID=UPI002B21EB70|nr:DUF4231 domain-containing protein [Leptothoe sp. PORK10 BA2]MEA5465972.1 DUF4231 domain-containing protein [Leptothoe sp. PORK10 BA2]